MPTRSPGSPVISRPSPASPSGSGSSPDPVELDLVAGLEARLADPLWLVGRQWQFAELKAENAGMPVKARLQGEAGRLTLEGMGDNFDGLPEAIIEAEFGAPGAGLAGGRSGLGSERRAGRAGRGGWVQRLSIGVSPPTSRGSGRRCGHDFVTLLGKYALDASALAAALSAERAPDGTLAQLPSSIVPGSGLADAMLKAADAWLADWTAILLDPVGEPRWQPARLEYSAILNAATSRGAVPIAVPEYGSGRFDWWTMDQAGSPSGSASVENIDAMRLPLPVRFPGMPADRLFEIEPSEVSPLATCRATGVHVMLLIEYAVAASNDWYQIPLTLPYGTAFDITNLTVSDTFGVETVVGPATASHDAWSMFEVNAGRFGDRRAPLFLFPAASARTMDGEPIEEVAMFREEAVNMAWAVERKLTGLTPAPFRPTDVTPQGQVVADPGPPDAALDLPSPNTGATELVSAHPRGGVRRQPGQHRPTPALVAPLRRRRPVAERACHGLVAIGYARPAPHRGARDPARRHPPLAPLQICP